MNNRMTILRLPATPASLAQVRQFLRGQLALSGIHGRTDDVVLAGHEAASNVVRHAYPGSGEVEVEVRPTQEGVTIFVRDEGRGHRTSTDNPGAGLGTTLMEGTADSVSISARSAPGTEVVLSFQQ